jgi:hypothetical protein
MPRIREGEVGCFFDDIGNLVEPTERPHKDVRTGPQRGRMPERRGWSRDSGPPLSGADARPGVRCRSTLCPNGPTRRRILEIDAHSAAICREDQYGEVGDGEGGGRQRPRRCGPNV